MFFLFGVIGLAAGLSDLRWARTGSISGARRLARHLWRMCFAFFIATGSFFLGQAKVIPTPLRIMPLLAALALAPLLALLYWLWRIRVRRLAENP
jgi:peptidoglycan/LPS O-acetylase OafA/YrhL